MVNEIYKEENITYWVAANNPNLYKMEDFLKLEKDDRYWYQGQVKYAVGDIVYIYVSLPIQEIKYKFKVEEINIPGKRDYGIDKDDPRAKNRKFMKVKVLEYFGDGTLTFENLQANGLKGRIQGPRRLSGQVLDFILSVDKQTEISNFYLSDDEEELREGQKIEVRVNKYERNLIARRKCLDSHGYTCTVCGFNFEEVYGGIGKDFIHVHHLIPLSKIDHTYIVNPVKDLIPLCPNCHAMIHKIDKKTGEIHTVDSLKNRLKKKPFI